MQLLFLLSKQTNKTHKQEIFNAVTCPKICDRRWCQIHYCFVIIANFTFQSKFLNDSLLPTAKDPQDSIDYLGY